MLIVTADQQLIASEFRTDDLNVRGPGDLSINPAVGDVSIARYPRDFMIHNHDQSPWAHKLACLPRRLEGRCVAAVQRPPGTGEFRHVLADVTAAEHVAGCP